MKNWTIKKRIIAGFTIIVVLTTIMGFMAWNSMRVIGEHADELSENDIVGMDTSADVLQNLNHAHLALIRHVVTTNLEEKRGIEGTLKEIAEINTKRFEEAEKACSSPEEKALFEKMKTARQDYVAARLPVLELSDAGKNAEAMALLMATARPAYDAYDKASMDFNDFEIKASTDAASTIQHHAKSSKLLLAGTVLAELAISTLLAFLIVTGLGRLLNHVSASLDDGSSQVSAAASQVSAASQTLAEGSSEQASSLEETSSSLEEMSAMTKRNSENARQANGLAKQAREAADKGVSDMQTMSAAMEAIKVSSDDIAKIIKTIDEIAFQTNILALNAAVEAARAGEAGMGFAVVADEVRNLAQRSATAAKETADKIEGAITKTSQGVEISSKVAAALNEIVTKARQVDELVSEVAGATREQTEGIAQINAAVGQMDKVTQGNAASAEESAAAAQELNAQAEVMKQSVGELLRLVGGQSDSAAIKNGKAFHAGTPRIKIPASNHRNGNGNGHSPAPKQRSNIPMEGDFKDF